MYFYLYNGKLYWGRYGNMATQRNVFGWIFRNKPAIPNRWYLSGKFAFKASFRTSPHGSWSITMFHDNGTESSFTLGSSNMVYLRDDLSIHAIDKSSVMRDNTEKAFRNRLREYKGKYFLPFHKHARCV